MKRDMLNFRVLGVATMFGTIAMVSCSGIVKKPEDATIKNALLKKMQPNAAILFSEDFESNTPFAKVHNLETGPEYALTYVAAPGNGAGKAARFELHKTDPLVKGGKRAEATIVPASDEKERWYAFSVYFPAEDFTFDNEQEVISQWWQRPDHHLGEKAGSPPAALRVKRDRFLLDVGFTAEVLASEIEKENRRKIDLGPVTKNEWHHFVFHIIHSYQPDGLVEIWHNGEKVLAHEGGNIYNNLILPKWKIGVYKASFKSGKSDVAKRVIYFDNIKVGNKQATFQDMDPARALQSKQE